MSDHTIMTLPADRAREAVDVLTDAFVADPAFVHVLPGPEQRRLALRAILGVAVRDAAAAGTARTIERDGRLAAVAVWHPPGRYPMTRRRQLRAVPTMMALSLRLRGRIRDLAAFGAAIDAHFPDDRVTYLQVLGVHPDHQRAGLGGALVRQGLAQADADHSDTHLETGKADNVGYYQRLGFELIDAPAELFPGGPPMWIMRRPTQPPRDTADPT